MVVNFIKYIIPKFIFEKYLYAVITDKDMSALEDIQRMVHRCKAFSDCKEVLYLSEVGNEKFIVQKVLCDHKGTKGFWVIRIIIGYIIETSKAIKETYIINFEGNEIVVKTKDKKVMTFEVNKREIKMVYPRRVASGQIKSGRVDSIQLDIVRK